MPPFTLASDTVAPAAADLHNLPMQARVINRIAGLLIFVAAAAMAAGVLAVFTHRELGISSHVIRVDALVSALLASGLLAIALFSHRLGRHK